MSIIFARVLSFFGLTNFRPLARIFFYLNIFTKFSSAFQTCRFLHGGFVSSIMGGTSPEKKGSTFDFITSLV